MNKYPLLGESLLVDVEGGIATVTLNRPKHHNALSRELRTNLAIAVESLQADDEVNVIIFTGAGDKAFSAGADLKEFEVAPLTPEEMGIESRFMRAFAALRKPTIAAINGYAVTGGFELVMNCDILVASTHARFADTHVRVGVLPGWGLSQYLPRTIGPVRARYLSFTGNYLDAQTAKEWGLVIEVVEPAQLMPYCRKMAQDILSCDQATLREYRDIIREGLNTTAVDGFAVESRLGKAGLARFDPAAFGAQRKKVIGRGRGQVGEAS